MFKWSKFKKLGVAKRESMAIWPKPFGHLFQTKRHFHVVIG
jgi:hypothetical protein